jgi:hypothetical protein
MAVPNADGDDAAKHVEISFSIVIEQPLHVTLVQQQRLFVIGQNAGNNVLLLDCLYFCVIWTLKNISINTTNKIIWFFYFI